MNEKKVMKLCRLFTEDRTLRFSTQPARTRLILEKLKQKKFLISVIQSRYCKSDHHIFLYLKKFLAYQSVTNDQETKDIL